MKKHQTVFETHRVEELVEINDILRDKMVELGLDYESAIALHAINYKLIKQAFEYGHECGFVKGAKDTLGEVQDIVKITKMW